MYIRETDAWTAQSLNTHRFTSAAISCWDKWQKNEMFSPWLSREHKGSSVHPGRLHWRPKINSVLYTSSIYLSTSPTIHLQPSSAISPDPSLAGRVNTGEAASYFSTCLDVFCFYFIYVCKVVCIKYLHCNMRWSIGEEISVQKVINHSQWVVRGAQNSSQLNNLLEILDQYINNNTRHQYQNSKR